MPAVHQIVIDTNVVVAAVRSNQGASHRLMRQLGDPRWQINLSVPLALEYEQTLKRVCTPGPPDPEAIEAILAFLCDAANLHWISFLWRPLLPDPKDHMVLELAIECRASFIVTFNLSDFGPAAQFGIGLVTPAQFLAIIEAQR